ncbi:MAG: 3-hydroxyacyl-CoA dehydrogenase NAD-binding domain-containing protein, partial [Nitrobacter sp.]
MAAMIRKVGVIGSGQMGNGIAHVTALAGMNVVLNDISADR